MPGTRLSRHTGLGHATLQFKQIHATKPIFSARIGIDWRAVCVRTGDTAPWYFIGSHAGYDRLIKTLRTISSPFAATTVADREVFRTLTTAL